ncbi:hypothetical protein AMATHDRAFT_135912 [Amanita thiersii Skay4041]|uniref:NAD-dependent epimerase/dehydratase domain-containing protein n=1 Tax=Amanita thiersii Skay4041 TaxID=703135 RepID=A0A2A9NTJ6_9AGAR|nr:hypothetical protein AMATHDRAFT_135912 [Amanita thiersii Skay4041]
MNTVKLHKILVVGGNGFIGSAVCKAALARGMQVTSISSSGRPYRTPRGHMPAWANKVEWQQGDALNPQTFAHIFPQVGGVVHTLGTLLESEGEEAGYKQSVKDGDLLGLVGHLLTTALGGGGARGNPLAKPTVGGELKKGSYEAMNRDAALRVCGAFMASSPETGCITEGFPRPFIYISAEDIFRPFIPARYIETKREAEEGVAKMMQGHPGYRGVYIRPSLVYHAHFRPLTTPAAVLFDLSATIHERIPHGIPTPSSMLRTMGSALSSSRRPSAGSETLDNIRGSSLESVANALVTPPIHVDSVAQAICVALEANSGVEGVVTVRKMRELIGWTKSEDEGKEARVA